MQDRDMLGGSPLLPAAPVARRDGCGKHLGKLRWLGVVIPLLGEACGARANAHDEAQKLLSAIAEIDLGAPLPRRQAQLQALLAMPIASEEVASVRDACGAAHRGLLLAEQAQAEARTRLDAVAAAKIRDDAELSAIAAQVAAAAEALRVAHGRLPECQTRTRALALRRR